jgi:hypothetical protein
VVLLVDDTLTTEFRAGGQLSLVISVETVFLFVMSGTGFTLPNSNVATSDSKLSGRNVPIDRNISAESLLGQLLTKRFLILRGSCVQFEELVDLSSLKLIKPFLHD